MTHQIRQSKEYDQMVKNMTDNLIFTIQKSIIDQTVDFSNKRASVDDILKKQTQGKKLKSPLSDDNKPLLDQLKSLKESKLFEIKQLQRKENILKKSSVNKKPVHSQSVPKLQKSQFTRQQMKQIKTIMKKKRFFEEQLKQKEEKLQKLIRQKKIEEDEHRRKVLQEKCQQRKKQLMKQREQVRKHQQQRKQKLQEEIIKIRQLKKRKILYEHMNQDWIKMQEAEQIQKKRLWEAEKIKRKLNPQEIVQHEKKYLEQKKERSAKRQQQLCLKRQQSRIELPYLYNRIYYENQKQEEYLKNIQKSKNLQIQNNINKKRQFAKLVKEIYLPKIKTKPEDILTAKNYQTSMKKEGLDYFSTFRLGNQYMKLVHEKIPLQKIEDQKKTIQVDQHGGYSVHYKNYLKQLKQLNKQNKKTNSNRLDLMNVLKNTKMDEGTKMLKIKQMAHKMDNNKNDNQIIESIKNKLSVLKELTN